MIEVQNLVKMYGDHTAVDHLSFRIEKGHIYGLLGPNGAGKSTTMNIMTGYLGATEGKVLIQGHDILKEPELAKKSIGYLPEQPPVYMDMTVREYLQFAAELKKIPKKEREKQMNDVIRMTGIREVENRLIQNLSKGYRQRVGLAQAILGFPEVIILDEPTVGLDPKQIIEIRELIRKLSKKHTIILSSHILAEIREVCDYIMIISRGKLVASDTPENLENRLKSSRHIELQAKAPVTRVQEILKEVSGIKKVDYRKDNNLMTTAQIETRNAKDIREEIFTAFARNNQPLTTLSLSQTTLEEVFLELTQGKYTASLAEQEIRDDEKEEVTSQHIPVAQIFQFFLLSFPGEAVGDKELKRSQQSLISVVLPGIVHAHEADDFFIS